MADDRLIALLRELRVELGGRGALGADARGVLDELRPELERLGAAPAAPPATRHGVEALAIRFEADHPSVAAALRQVADMLGNAGI
jgi:Domain of unknown function (DUF4404)